MCPIAPRLSQRQWAYLGGIRDFILEKKDYLMTQVGNPDGADKPNKKSYDPRLRVRMGEVTLMKRVIQAQEDLLQVFFVSFPTLRRRADEICPLLRPFSNVNHN